MAHLIFTVGHSTHSLAALVELLRRHDIARLIDVRRFPTSRRMPHFAKQSLEESLPAEGVAYLHLPELGGRRRPRAESPNLGWRSEGFRGYADYMETGQFADALERLTVAATERRSALMCAEALWWRCHRRLISDALVARGWRVCHIASGGKVAEHEVTPFAVLEDGRLTYPAEQTSLEL